MPPPILSPDGCASPLNHPWHLHQFPTACAPIAVSYTSHTSYHRPVTRQARTQNPSSTLVLRADCPQPPFYRRRITRSPTPIHHPSSPSRNRPIAHATAIASHQPSPSSTTAPMQQTETPTNSPIARPTTPQVPPFPHHGNVPPPRDRTASFRASSRTWNRPRGIGTDRYRGK